MKLKIEQYNLSPQDELPDDIKCPEKLIKKITKKLKINPTGKNINKTFQWIKLGEEVLERYSAVNDKLIINLQYNLARVLYDRSDYDKSKELLENIIEKCLKSDIYGSKVMSIFYWLLTLTLLGLNDHENARNYIDKSITLYKNDSCYNAALANVLFHSGEAEEAERYYKKALKLCINTEGKKHLNTAAIFCEYGNFLLSIGKISTAKKYLNNAYIILKEKCGIDGLYTLRALGHISNLLYAEKKYSEAFAKMKIAYLGLKNILGENDFETLTCKLRCAKILVKMKNYDELGNYLEHPFIIAAKNEIMLLFAYDGVIMEAPELIISKKGPSMMKITAIMERQNIPIIKNYLLAKKMIDDCYEFEPILPKYYRRIASILSKIWKEEPLNK